MSQIAFNNLLKFSRSLDSERKDPKLPRKDLARVNLYPDTLKIRSFSALLHTLNEIKVAKTIVKIFENFKENFSSPESALTQENVNSLSYLLGRMSDDYKNKEAKEQLIIANDKMLTLFNSSLFCIGELSDDEESPDYGKRADEISRLMDDDFIDSFEIINIKNISSEYYSVQLDNLWKMSEKTRTNKSLISQNSQIDPVTLKLTKGKHPATDAKKKEVVAAIVELFKVENLDKARGKRQIKETAYIQLSASIKELKDKFINDPKEKELLEDALTGLSIHELMNMPEIDSETAEIVKSNL